MSRFSRRSTTPPTRGDHLDTISTDMIGNTAVYCRIPEPRATHLSIPSMSSPNPPTCRTSFLVSPPYRESVSGFTGPPLRVPHFRSRRAANPRPSRRQWRRHLTKASPPCTIFKPQPTTPEKNGEHLFRSNTPITRQAGEGKETPSHETQQRDKLQDQYLQQPTPPESTYPLQPAHTTTEYTPTPRHSLRAAYTGDRVSFTYQCSMGALLCPAETHHKLTTAMSAGCRIRACSGVHGELGCFAFS
jgi:hypothetical protein